MLTKNHFTRLLGAVLLLVLASMMAVSALAQGPSADLSVSKTVDNPAPFDGDTIVFTITVTNVGPDSASGVNVADTLPAGVTYASDDGLGAYDSLTGVWTIGSLAASSSLTLHITATVDSNTDGDVIVNTAVVSGAESDPDTANNSATATIAVRINDLCARTGGSLTPPVGSPVAFWGYAPGDCASGNPPQLPGPVLVYQQGETVSLTLHNSLAAPSGIKFDSSGLLPDLTGAAVGGSKTYTFVAGQPGTFLYEAAPLSNAQHQSAMGLYGAMIVRPSGTPGWALADPATQFDSEAVLVLSEIDPALNNRANPATFDMRRYKPRYWLINGKAYPQTSPIMTAAGQKLLLRYVNAGQQPHSMAILGMNQQFLTLGGARLTDYRLGLSQLMMPGQSADAIAAVPTSAAAGMKFPLYETGLMLHNNGAPGFGGMLAFLETQAGAPSGDVAGPAAYGLVLEPNPTNGTVDVTLSATLDDSGSGGASITAAEFFIGAPGADGTGTPMSPVDLTFDSASEDVTASILAADLPTTAGAYSIYVHGQDANGNWGTFNFIVLNLDKTGPTTSGIVLTPAFSNGSLDIAIQATGNDSYNGGSNIAAAEYFIDTTGADGTGTAMTVNVSAPVASLNGTIPANTLAGGAHTLYVHSQDALGNWGMLGGFTFSVDQTGPTTSNVRSTPTASNGATSVRADATVSDTNANIATAELFLDVVGAPGSGLQLMTLDGAFNELNEDVYGFIPQAQVNALSSGAHTIWVRGRDAAGNWGTETGGTLIIDKVVPTITTPVASPNPTNGAPTFTLTSTASDAASNISRAEWFRGTDPGYGNGTAMSAADGTFDSLNEGLSATVSISGWAPGNHIVFVRAMDTAGNWSATASTVVNVIQSDVLFSDSFESGNTSAWNGGATGPVSVTPAAAMAATTQGMQVAFTGNQPGYVTDNSPANETTYHARFYFNPRGTLSGNTQMDIFAARNTVGVNVVRVQYRRTGAGGGTYQVRLSVSRFGGTTNTNWVTITNNAAHYIELDWQSAASATARFYVDGVLQQTLTGLNTAAFTVDTVLLGPSGGLVATAGGTPYFDQFESRRTSYIGP